MKNELRKRIAQKYCGSSQKIGVILADRVLVLVRDEIKNVENPYGHRTLDYQEQKAGWEEARQDILGALGGSNEE